VYFSLLLGVYRVNKKVGDERFFLCFFQDRNQKREAAWKKLLLWLQQNNQQEEEETRGFFVFFKIGIKREKQIGKIFCVRNRTIDKKKKRGFICWSIHTKPANQTLEYFQFLEGFKTDKFFFLHTFCRLLIQFSSFFFPRVHPRTTEGLCEREREKMKVFLSCRQATRQAANGRGIDLFCTFFKSSVRIINKCYSVWADSTFSWQNSCTAKAGGGHLQKEGTWREGITIAVPCDSCQSTTSSFGYP
jgi:hypothetical protein